MIRKHRVKVVRSDDDYVEAVYMDLYVVAV
jgi:hypothetical protein